jgi:hypothetical protein
MAKRSASREQIFRGTCNGGGAGCGREISFRFSIGPAGETWKLLVYDLEAGERVAVDDRRCPSCGISYAGLSADALKNLFSPGATANEAENGEICAPQG